MSTTITDTRTTVCETCDDEITITIVVGKQRWDDVEWVHTDTEQQPQHEPKPELRLVIDATCPNCDYPEIGYAPSREEFVCSRCRHRQDERPAS